MTTEQRASESAIRALIEKWATVGLRKEAGRLGDLPRRQDLGARLRPHVHKGVAGGSPWPS